MQFDGSLGWLAVANEAVAYGTLGTPLVYMHGLDCKIKLIRERVEVPTLGTNLPQIGLVHGTRTEGPFSVALSTSATLMAPIYALAGTDAGVANTWVIGTAAPEATSLSVFADIDGVEYDYAGNTLKKLTWTLNNTGHSVVTADVQGVSMVKYAGGARSPVLPATSAIAMPGDITALTIGATAIGSCKAATITYEPTVSGFERRRFGSTTLPLPIRSDCKVKASLTVELDDAVGNATTALVDSFIANSTISNVVIGNMTLASCYIMEGNPELARGPRDLVLQVEGLSMSIVTI